MTALPDIRVRNEQWKLVPKTESLEIAGKDEKEKWVIANGPRAKALWDQYKVFDALRLMVQMEELCWELGLDERILFLGAGGVLEEFLEEDQEEERPEREDKEWELLQGKEGVAEFALFCLKCRPRWRLLSAFAESLFRSPAEWKHVVQKEELNVWYSHQDGNPCHTLRMCGFFADTPLLDIVTLFYEVELFKTWVPFMTESVEIADCGVYEKAVQVRLGGLPWPLATRTMNLYGFFVDALESDGVLALVVRSLKEEDGLTIPEVEGDVVMDVKFLGVSFQPVTGKGVFVQFLASIDVKLDLVPSPLASFGTKVFAPMVFEALQKCAKEVGKGGKWEEGKVKNKGFYEEMGRRIEKCREV